tara:strand:- start:3406 stop:3603 length:198 start_codon:yes stop_codon:yes gene_type:complete
MKVKCIVSRRIADDDYQLGQEYNVTKERVEKYPSSFEVIPVIEKPKQSAKKTETKRVAKTEDKSG